MLEQDYTYIFLYEKNKSPKGISHKWPIGALARDTRQIKQYILYGEQISHLHKTHIKNMNKNA